MYAVKENPWTNYIHPSSELWALFSFSSRLRRLYAWIQQKRHSKKIQLQGKTKRIKQLNSYNNLQ